MLFKYQAPQGYKCTSIVIAGHQYEVKEGIVSSDDDIIHVLKPLGFERFIEQPETKKPTTKATAE